MAAIIAVNKVPGGGAYTCQVPLDLLSEDGVPPAQGDSVSYSVDGTVQSVSDTDATVKITAVNGSPIAGGGGDTGSSDSGGDQSTADLGRALRAGAKNQPLPFQ